MQEILEKLVRFLAQEEPWEEGMAPTPVFSPRESSEQASVHRVTKSWTVLKRLHTHTRTKGLRYQTTHQVGARLKSFIPNCDFTGLDPQWGGIEGRDCGGRRQELEFPLVLEGVTNSVHLHCHHYLKNYGCYLHFIN